MANDKNLKPFDSERARKVASQPRVGPEKVVKKQFRLRPDQVRWLEQNVSNGSKLIRDLLDKHIEESSR